MSSPTRWTAQVEHWRTALIALALLVGLFFLQKYSYALFHGLAETFSIVVACTIFAVFWNARPFLDNTFYLFTGIAYLFVALLDLLHTFSVGKVLGLSGLRHGLGIQLWVGGGGFCTCLSLIAALSFMRWRISSSYPVRGLHRHHRGDSGPASSTGQVFPVCFVSGTGLTPFKITSEVRSSAGCSRLPSE